MRKFVLLACVLAGLAGCASGPKPTAFGSFAPASDTAADKAMVSDVVKQLTALYPPAKTRFNLQHPATDPFGAALVSAMRAKGYALQEFEGTPDAKTKQDAAGGQTGYRLAYVFDQPVGTDLYRVTVNINEQSLSRVYQAKAGAATPAGYWVRKE